MIKHVFFFLFNIFIVCELSGLNVHEYQFEIVGYINIGDRNSELGRENTEMPGIDPMYPGPLTISEKERIYIFDEYYQKFNIYDINLNFLFNIDTSYQRTKMEINYIYRMKFDEKENLYLIIAGSGRNELLRINCIDKTITKINMNDRNDDVFSRYDFFPFKEGLIYHEKDQTKILVFDETKIIPEEVSQFIYADTNKKNIFHNSPVLLNELPVFLKENKIILYGNRLLTTDKRYWMKYYNFIKNNIPNKKIVDKIRIDKDDAMQTFLGFDKSDNVYWKGYTNDGMVITAIDEYGEILDCFKNFKGGVPAISPTGDVYYLESDNIKVTVFRIRNTWDPIPDTTPVIPKVTSLNATSFIDFKNMYTPRMLFDSKPETAWLEGKKDAGIGESVTLTLDTAMTIDRLAIAPGYFDTKWWKANNRIKKLLIELDSYKKEAVFRDEMVMQDVMLEKSISFKKVKFTILEVYSSGKDNDTAISDISFFNNGKKIEPDMSGIK